MGLSGAPIIADGDGAHSAGAFPDTLVNESEDAKMISFVSDCGEDAQDPAGFMRGISGPTTRYSTTPNRGRIHRSARVGSRRRRSRVHRSRSRHSESSGPKNVGRTISALNATPPPVGAPATPPKSDARGSSYLQSEDSPAPSITSVAPPSRPIRDGLWWRLLA